MERYFQNESEWTWVWDKEGLSWFEPWSKTKSLLDPKFNDQVHFISSVLWGSIADLLLNAEFLLDFCVFLSRWIAAQQKSTNGETGESSNGDDLLGCSPSYRDPEKKIFGCEHYKRNCKLRAVCCGKLFTCRFCHDKVSDHSMDRYVHFILVLAPPKFILVLMLFIPPIRKATSEMMCMRCCEIQPVGPVCTTPSCNELSMAQYYCSICKFFDDER